MTCDSKLKTGLIAGVALVDILLIVAMGLTFPLHHIVRPIGFGLLLGLVAWYYNRRGIQSFTLCVLALLQLVLFTPGYTVLMYGITATARPLADGQLMQFDSLVGVHLPTIVEWVQNHPGIKSAMGMIYNTLLYQMPLLVILLGFKGERRPLESFVLRFMVAALVTAFIYWLAPAAGPFTGYGYAPNPDQERYLEHFHTLRNGERTVVTWEGAEGLITFPSFHTTWAILLAAAVYHRRRLFVISAVLNGLVVLSTLTTGWHYFSDVLGGIIVAGFAVALCNALAPILYPEADDARPVAQPASSGQPDLIA